MTAYTDAANTKSLTDAMAPSLSHKLGWLVGCLRNVITEANKGQPKLNWISGFKEFSGIS